MQISGHENVNSINNYSKLNSNQSRQISDILSNKSASAKPATATVSKTVSTVDPVSTTDSSRQGIPPGFFINSTIYGNVILNMGSRTESRQLSQTNHLQVSNEHSNQASPVLEIPYQRPFKRIRCISDSDSD